MKPSAIAGLVAAVAFQCVVFSGDASCADPPKDRVVAIYFHRTQRCPTCQKMGSYAEQSVRSKFTDQLKDGTVKFHYVDFQNKKNAALAKGYRISGPALIVARISGNKVMEYRNLDEIWAKVRDKPAFFEYVQQAISKYRES